MKQRVPYRKGVYDTRSLHVPAFVSTSTHVIATGKVNGVA